MIYDYAGHFRMSLNEIYELNIIELYKFYAFRNLDNKIEKYLIDNTK